MTFIKPDINVLIMHISTIDEGTKPSWGQMSAIRMVEHLADGLRLAKGDHSYKLTIPEDKTESAQQFLASDHPFPKNFNVEFATIETKERCSSIKEAIQDLELAWNEFNKVFDGETNKTTLHPNFGQLNFDKWMRVHSKHFTHHLQQFGVDV